jgi:hypothetical protein
MREAAESQLRSFCFSCLAAAGDLQKLESEGAVRIEGRKVVEDRAISDYVDEPI